MRDDLDRQADALGVLRAVEPQARGEAEWPFRPCGHDITYGCGWDVAACYAFYVHTAGPDDDEGCEAPREHQYRTGPSRWDGCDYQLRHNQETKALSYV